MTVRTDTELLAVFQEAYQSDGIPANAFTLSRNEDGSININLQFKVDNLDPAVADSDSEFWKKQGKVIESLGGTVKPHSTQRDDGQTTGLTFSNIDPVKLNDYIDEISRPDPIISQMRASANAGLARREPVAEKFAEIFGASEFHLQTSGPIGYSSLGAEYSISIQVANNKEAVTSLIDNHLLQIREELGLTKEQLSFGEGNGGHLILDPKYRDGQLLIVVRDTPEIDNVIQALESKKDEIKAALGQINPQATTKAAAAPAAPAPAEKPAQATPAATPAAATTPAPAQAAATTTQPLAPAASAAPAAATQAAAASTTPAPAQAAATTKPPAAADIATSLDSATKQLELRRLAEQAAFKEFGKNSDEVRYYQSVFGFVNPDNSIGIKNTHIYDSNPVAVFDANRDGVLDIENVARLQPYQADGAYAVASRIQQHITAEVSGSEPPRFNKSILLNEADRQNLIEGWLSKSLSSGAKDKLLAAGQFNYEKPPEPIAPPAPQVNADGSVTLGGKTYTAQELAQHRAFQRSPVILSTSAATVSLNTQTPAGINQVVDAANPNINAILSVTGDALIPQAPAAQPSPQVATAPTVEAVENPPAAPEPASLAQEKPAAVAPEPAVNTNTYTIKPGDSLSAIIAERYNGDNGIPNNAIGYIMLREAIEQKNGLLKITGTDLKLAIASGTEIQLPSVDEVKQAFSTAQMTYENLKEEIQAFDPNATTIASKNSLEAKGISLA